MSKTRKAREKQRHRGLPNKAQRIPYTKDNQQHHHPSCLFCFSHYVPMVIIPGESTTNIWTVIRSSSGTNSCSWAWAEAAHWGHGGQVCSCWGGSVASITVMVVAKLRSLEAFRNAVVAADSAAATAVVAKRRRRSQPKDLVVELETPRVLCWLLLRRAEDDMDHEEAVAVSSSWSYPPVTRGGVDDCRPSPPNGWEGRDDEGIWNLVILHVGFECLWMCFLCGEGLESHKLEDFRFWVLRLFNVTEQGHSFV